MTINYRHTHSINWTASSGIATRGMDITRLAIITSVYGSCIPEGWDRLNSCAAARRRQHRSVGAPELPTDPRKAPERQAARALEWARAELVSASASARGLGSGLAE